MRPRRQPGRLFSIAVTIAAITVIGGLVTYWVSSPSSSQDVEMEPQDKKTKCIIISESIANSSEIDWELVLTKDVVLLVVPGVSFPHRSYKVIRCETMSGLWSCVRHLKKEQLLLIPTDLQTGFPADIQRYTSRIVHIPSDKVCLPI